MVDVAIVDYDEELLAVGVVGGKEGRVVCDVRMKTGARWGLVDVMLEVLDVLFAGTLFFWVCC